MRKRKKVMERIEGDEEGGAEKREKQVETGEITWAENEAWKDASSGSLPHQASSRPAPSYSAEAQISTT